MLVFSTRRFDFPIRGRRDRRVGTSAGSSIPSFRACDSPWPPDDRRPLVLVSPAVSTAASGRHSSSRSWIRSASCPCAYSRRSVWTRTGTVQAPANAVVKNCGAARSGAARRDARRDERRSQHRSRRPCTRRPGPGLPAHARAGMERQARRGVRGGTATGAERDVERDPSGARGAPLRPRRSQTFEAGRPCSRDRGGGGERAADHLERLLAP